MVPDQAQVARFASDLDALLARDVPAGIAVSGGPDSVALLLLAAAARPTRIEVATIDHALRPGARAEAEMVAALCSDLRVPHSILTARWETPPETAIQERARRERYRLLGYWAEERRLAAIVTAHHADDQAETFLMRLLRGSGVRGLAAMRPKSIAAGAHVRLLRPLLAWRRAELRAICDAAGVIPAHDPSNDDDRYERVRIRRILAENEWLDGGAIAASASHLAEADEALRWAIELEWRRSVEERRDRFVYHPGDVPREIMRRIVGRIVRKLAMEGDDEIRGGELNRLLASLSDGRTATLRGVLCEGGRSWRFERAPLRR